jgi:hypothetical protein
MSSSLLKKNLASLKKKDQALFEKISPLIGSRFYTVTQSRSGLPALIHIDQEGNKRQIDSIYDPVGDASRYSGRLKICESLNFIVLGLGLGYPVFEIIRHASKRAKFYIFEKDPELFALAIREIDFSAIFDHPGVKLFVDANPCQLEKFFEPEQINFVLNDYCLVSQKSLVDKNIEYYGILLDGIEKYFKESRINLKTQSVHSKLYYKNIFSNFENLISSPGITSLKGCLPNVPAIICSAGPSLDKNIQLIKCSRQRFFLIAVATALKPLRHNGIHPDVVISIDPDEQTINSFDFLNDDNDTWLVYNPAVPSIIPNAFPNRRIAFDLEMFLSEWFKKHTEEKGGLGKITSVAHSAFKFAQYLSCSPIILVGQDLSFFKQRLHCLHSFYLDESINAINRLNPLFYRNRLKFLNFSSNLIEATDLFDCKVASSLALESYNYIFSQSLGGFQTVINATEGGVPIKGMENQSLREAIHHFCKKPVRNKCDLLFRPKPARKVPLKSLRDAALFQIHNLNDLSEKLNTIKCKFSNVTEAGNKQLFVQEMEAIYKNMLKDEETALLLQGYNFSGFSDWYCTNSHILREKGVSEDCSLLEKEFKRDMKFLKTLTDSVEYLRTNFKRSLSR